MLTKKKRLIGLGLVLLVVVSILCMSISAMGYGSRSYSVSSGSWNNKATDVCWSTGESTKIDWKNVLRTGSYASYKLKSTTGSLFDATVQKMDNSGSFSLYNIEVSGIPRYYSTVEYEGSSVSGTLSFTKSNS